MTIIGRYVLRECVQSWLLVTFVLLGILLTNQVAVVLGDAAANEIPRDAVFFVIGLTTLQYLKVLLPIAFLVGVMFALSRLYRDSEMAALMACGIGPRRLYLAIFPLALVLCGGLFWLSLKAAPEAKAEVEVLKAEVQQRAGLGVVEPGRFVSVDDGRIVIYAGGEDNGVLTNLFVQRRIGERVEVVVAERGETVGEGPDGPRMVVLHNGKRYEGVPGHLDFNVIEFAEHGIPLPQPQADDNEAEIEAIPTAQLMADRSDSSAAELQWRLAPPVSMVVLLVLAVPLSRTGPRQGRYGRLVLGVGLYIIYSNLLAAGRVWLTNGQVPAWLGMWWIHAIMLLVGLLLLAGQAGMRAARATGRKGA